MTPQADGLPLSILHRHHGRHRPPLAALVSRGSAQDRLNTRKYHQGFVGSVLSHWGGGGGNIIIYQLRETDSRLPMVTRLQGGPDPGDGVPGLLGVEQEGMMHVLHLFFSVPVNCYPIERSPLVFSGDITPERLS